ncbi:MAG: RrF2 family transcriptional regulator [Armatimonadota bacterium]|jgi:Rrf2 family protein|nr:MAG: AsnC family transcriptional regulator [Armatimonadota bacterium]
MNFTAREDYGLRAALDLALNVERGPVQSREIATRQGIPEQFLEQLLGALRRGGLVRSVRGAAGGYLLAAPPSAITVGDVLRTLSGPLVPVSCVMEEAEGPCEHEASFGVHTFWKRLADAVTDLADGMTLQDLVDIQLQADAQSSFMMNI